MTEPPLLFTCLLQLSPLSHCGRVSPGALKMAPNSSTLRDGKPCHVFLLVRTVISPALGLLAFVSIQAACTLWLTLFFLHQVCLSLLGYLGWSCRLILTYSESLFCFSELSSLPSLLSLFLEFFSFSPQNIGSLCLDSSHSPSKGKDASVLLSYPRKSIHISKHNY